MAESWSQTDSGRPLPRACRPPLRLSIRSRYVDSLTLNAFIRTAPGKGGGLNTETAWGHRHEWPRKLRIVTAQVWIKIRMATNVEIHMSLRLLNRAAVHVYCHYWPLTFIQRAPPTYSSGISKISCVSARASIIVSWNSTGSCVVYITLVLGQLSELSKDACCTQALTG